MLETMATWLAYFAGPMLGLFLLGMLTRVRERAALLGVGCGAAYAIALAMLHGGLPFHRLWICPISCAITLATGILCGNGSRWKTP